MRTYARLEDIQLDTLNQLYFDIVQEGYAEDRRNGERINVSITDVVAIGQWELLFLELAAGKNR